LAREYFLVYAFLLVDRRHKRIPEKTKLDEWLGMGS